MRQYEGCYIQEGTEKRYLILFSASNRAYRVSTGIKYCKHIPYSEIYIPSRIIKKFIQKEKLRFNG